MLIIGDWNELKCKLKERKRTKTVLKSMYFLFSYQKLSEHDKAIQDSKVRVNQHYLMIIQPQK